jgi:flagellar basal-body rod protein FlgB
MSWLQTKQSVLAENVANSDTPGYRSRAISDFELPQQHKVATPDRLLPTRTNPVHLTGFGATSSAFGVDETDTFEITPSGNSVILEEEMMKVAETQLDYQMATGLYSRGIGLLKTAIGRRA